MNKLELIQAIIDANDLSKTEAETAWYVARMPGGVRGGSCEAAL